MLPLTNLTNDPDQEYLVDGVQEALIGELGKVGVKVISRSSTLGYRNTAKSTREIAESSASMASARVPSFVRATVSK